MDLLSWTDLARSAKVEHELPAVDVSQRISLSKIVDAVDFFRPDVIEHLRHVGQEPRLHNKQWEYAQQLEAKKRYLPPGGRIAGLGCGCETTIPLMAEGASEFVVTDLYGAKGAWGDASRRPDEVWPEQKNLTVVSMDMRKIELQKESFDFVSSLCAIEHIGFADAVIDVARQAGQLLKPKGVFFLSTEFTFDKKAFYAPGYPSGTLYLSTRELRRLFTETGLHLVEPMDLRVSTHPLNIPLWDQINNKGYPNLPHVLYRNQPMPFWGTYAATVSMVLSREDHGNDRIIEDPNQLERLKPLFEMGRRLSRRLTLPTRWW